MWVIVGSCSIIFGLGIVSSALNWGKNAPVVIPLADPEFGLVLGLVLIVLGLYALSRS